MDVAYLVNQHPSISHTFIRREIEALERRGVIVRRFAVRAPKAAVIAAEDKSEVARTRYIIGAGAPAILAGFLRTLLAAPGSSLKALADAMGLVHRSQAGLVRHLIYYVEAMVLAAWLREGKLAHVHAHFGTNSATVAMLAARIAGARFSMTVHGPEEFDNSGGHGLAKKIEASRFTAGVSSFGVSQLRRLVAPAFWERIKIVRCGVEAGFHAGARARLPAAPVFVSVGRLSEQKGQLTLVEAAARLKSEGREFIIRIVGDGPLRGDIEAAARRLDVEDRLTLAGWKTPAEVRAEIEAARIFVLPSYAEGLPVSIMEAFSLERPVISTSIAGIPELVLPGVNGWLVPAGDAEALADAMAAALDESDETLRAMGAAGRARVAERHDIDRIAEELAAHFEAAS